MSQNTQSFHGSTHALIAERAYLIAESHGFTPGKEEEFWREAERELFNASTLIPTAAPVEAASIAPIEAEAPTEIIAIAKPRTRAPRAKADAIADAPSGIEIITPEGATLDKPKRAPRTSKPKSA